MNRMASLVCVLALAAGCAAASSAPEPTAASTTSLAAEPASTSAEAVPAAASPGAHHCEGSPAQCGANAAPPLPSQEAGGKRYGAAADAALSLTALSDLLARPADFANKTVRTSGTVGRVCQQRGCWMELRADTGNGVARVPMAGHAFFVPKDISGRAAVVEGLVSVREGTENPLRIDASSVLVAEN